MEGEGMKTWVELVYIVAVAAIVAAYELFLALF
jgi:hypothetical protein